MSRLQPITQPTHSHSTQLSQKMKFRAVCLTVMANANLWRYEQEKTSRLKVKMMNIQKCSFLENSYSMGWRAIEMIVSIIITTVFRLFVLNDLPLFITRLIRLFMLPNCRKSKKNRLQITAIEKLRYFTTVSIMIKFKQVHHFITEAYINFKKSIFLDNHFQRGIQPSMPCFSSQNTTSLTVPCARRESVQAQSYTGGSRARRRTSW